MLLLFLAIQTASLPVESGNEFLRQCDDNTSPYTQCLAFAIGVYRGLKMSGVPICLPPSVQTGQMVQIAKKYIRDHPETAHYGPEYGMAISWQAAFPCKLAK